MVTNSENKSTTLISDWIDSLPYDRKPKILSFSRITQKEFSVINSPIKIKEDVNHHLFG